MLERRNRSLLLAYLQENDAACPGCGYNLRAIHHPHCPECGIPVALTIGRVNRPIFAILVLLAPLAMSLGDFVGWVGYSITDLPGMVMGWFDSFAVVPMLLRLVITVVGTALVVSLAPWMQKWPQWAVWLMAAVVWCVLGFLWLVELALYHY